MAKNLRWGGILFAGAITAMAGFVDGVGFVHFGGYFLSFMSGNSTRSSAALMTGDLTGWINAMSLVASFVIGVVIATLLTSSLAALRRPLAMYLSAGLLLAAAAAGTVQPNATALLLSAAMGVVNVSYTRSGEVALGLTYMTGTLVKLGQALGGAILGLVTGSNQGVNRLLWLRYAVLWAMITVGSLGGVFAYLHLGLGSLWIVGAGMLLWATLALFQELRAKADPRSGPATAITDRQRID
ncbi:YoaK family protein [Glutamicibacter halophytocola]|uniref:YoaK family protein n=1 Tax=Glutamicibacter halophytocola TaxID=1933880 RepID=A0AA94XYC9_9MICC|nr:YoaK family protein [Glutamicibacter halophytocola]UUX59408.1 YoaK family protein [Glutamicibacter halophytocola]